MLEIWFWIGGGFLLAVAAAATWFAFQRPGFWIGMAKVVFAAMLPLILKRNPPEEEALDHEAVRQARERGPVHGHRGK